MTKDKNSMLKVWAAILKNKPEKIKEFKKPKTKRSTKNLKTFRISQNRHGLSPITSRNPHDKFQFKCFDDLTDRTDKYMRSISQEKVVLKLVDTKLPFKVTRCSLPELPKLEKSDDIKQNSPHKFPKSLKTFSESTSKLLSKYSTFGNRANLSKMTNITKYVFTFLFSVCDYYKFCKFRLTRNPKETDQSVLERSSEFTCSMVSPVIKRFYYFDSLVSQQGKKVIKLTNKNYDF